jgi:ssDNA-binding Zn-finger/Zn-ribbon topoisomerase 1
VKLQARLRRLERDLGTPDCPECRERRGQTVLCRVRDGEDEQGVGSDWPAPCPRCGEVPEQIIEIVEVLVTTREEVERLRDLAGPGAWSASRPF